jgi:hypothetical protein
MCTLSRAPSLELGSECVRSLHLDFVDDGPCCLGSERVCPISLKSEGGRLSHLGYKGVHLDVCEVGCEGGRLCHLALKGVHLHLRDLGFGYVCLSHPGSEGVCLFHPGSEGVHLHLLNLGSEVRLPSDLGSEGMHLHLLDLGSESVCRVGPGYVSSSVPRVLACGAFSSLTELSLAWNGSLRFSDWRPISEALPALHTLQVLASIVLQALYCGAPYAFPGVAACLVAVLLRSAAEDKVGSM